MLLKSFLSTYFDLIGTVSVNFILVCRIFWGIFFNFFLFPGWAFNDLCQRFICNKERNFSLIRQNLRIFPMDTHCKNRSLW